MAVVFQRPESLLDVATSIIAPAAPTASFTVWLPRLWTNWKFREKQSAWPLLAAL